MTGTNQTISGSTTFKHFTKTVAAADTLNWGAGDTQTFAGLLTLRGAAGQLLSLRSTATPTMWMVNVTNQGSIDIEFIDVQDGEAGPSFANHTPFNPNNSIDSGNNNDWFGIVWDGGGPNNNWSSPNNWSTNSVPGPTEVAVFTSLSAKDVVINANVDVLGIMITSGYAGTITTSAGNTVTVGVNGFKQYGSSYTGSADAIDVNGSFVLNGGTFTSSSTTLNVAADFSNGGGTFTHNSGSVILDGTAQILCGSTTFNNFTKSVTTADTLSICAGSTQTIAGTTILKGISGQALTIVSSTPSTQYILNMAQASHTGNIEYINIQDADATGSTTTPVNPANSTDSGNNTLWFPNAVTSALAEVKPNTVGTNSTSNSFNYYITPTIGGSATGVNQIVINTVDFSALSVTGVSIAGASKTLDVGCASLIAGEYCASVSDPNITITFGDYVTNAQVIQIDFSATAPAGSGSRNFTSTLDDTSTPSASAQSSSSGDGDNGSDGGSYVVNVTTGYNISGRVFEDIVIDGSDYNGADDNDLVAVDIELYDNNDLYLRSTTTDASGLYSFSNVADGITYKVRVRSDSIHATDLPEMTWANGVALYGGQDVNVDDTTIADNAGPGDTYSSVTVAAANKTNINFGFAYNFVSNTQDAGQGSLRQAILDTAASATIQFYATSFPTGAPATITLASDLPAMSTGDVNLDASNAGVILDGASSYNCIQIASNNNIVRGLRIQNCVAQGVLISSGTGNTIGGDNSSGTGPSKQGNIIVSNGSVGLQINSVSNFVYGNYIGTDTAGTDLGNTSSGIYLTAGSNIIGSTSATNRNIIAGNGSWGIDVNSSNNAIINNYIGVDFSGATALANTGGGVQLQGTADANFIGGTAANSSNVISGNGGDGIYANSSNTASIYGNYIGTNSASASLANAGDGIEIAQGALSIGSAAEAQINIIGPNTGFGINITGGSVNTAGTIDVNDDIELASGTISLTSATINLSGHWINTAAIVNPGTSVVNLDGTNDQTITSGGRSFANLVMNNTGVSGSDDIIISDALDINANLTLTDGDFDINASNPSVNTAGNVSIAANASIDVSTRTANWTFDGTSILNDSHAAGSEQNLNDVIVDGAPGSLSLASSTKMKSINVQSNDSVDLASSAYVFELTGTGSPLTLTGGGVLDASGNSTVRYSGEGAGVNISNIAYYNLELKPPTSATTYSLSGAQTVAKALLGDLTINNNASLDATAANSYALTSVNVMINAGGTYLAQNSIIKVSGDWLNAGSFTPGNSSLIFNGTSAQSVTSGVSNFYDVTVSNSTTPLSVDFLDGFNLHDLNAITASSVLRFKGTANYTFSGALNINGQSTSTRINLLSDNTGVDKFTFTVPSVQSVDYVDVSDGDAAGFDITANFSINSGNNDNAAASPHWIFSSTIEGTVYTDEGTTNIGSGYAVRLIVNGVDKGTVTTGAGGIYSHSVPTSAGDSLLLYLDDEGASNATTVTVSDGANLSALDLYTNHLIVRNDNAGNLSNANISTAIGAFVDAGAETDDILFSIDGSNNLSVSANTELFIPVGETYIPGANVSTVDFENRGSFTGGANTITVSGNLVLTSGAFTASSGNTFIAGNFTYTAGTFSHNNGTFNFNGAADQSITTGAQLFNHFVLNNTGGAGIDDVIIIGGLDINGNLTITDGDLDISTNNPIVNTAANVSIGTNGSIDVSARTSNWIFDGSSILSDSSSAGPQDLEDVVVDGGVTASLTLASSTTMQTLSIGADDTVDLAASAYVLELNATGTPLSITVGGSLDTSASSTVKYSGEGAGVNISNIPYFNLQVTPPSVATVYSLTGHQTAASALLGTLTIDNNASIDATAANNYGLSAAAISINAGGTYLAQNSAITLSGNFSNSGTFSPGNSSISLNGTGTQTITTGASNLYDVTVSNNSAAVTFADAFNMNNFSATTASTALIFKSAASYTIAGTLNLNGQASGTRISLRSDNTGVGQFDFNVTSGAQTVSFVDVADATAS
ncbi:MAG: hypothetical protein OEZ58_12905, partial [Gammaproteobacteria bacterium]|nr:hypothetical protein [Gammaproteobacteria bacterium]